MVPLRLNLAYLFFIPLILLWMQSIYVLYGEQRARGESLKLELLPTGNRLLIPLFTWFLLALLCAPFGVAPLHSIRSLISPSFFLILALVVAEVNSRHGSRRTLSALLIGSVIAAMHTLLEPLLPQSARTLLIGALSESGQLALIIPLSFFLLWVEQKRIPPYREVVGVGITLATLGTLFAIGGFFLFADSQNITALTHAITHKEYASALVCLFVVSTVVGLFVLQRSNFLSKNRVYVLFSIALLIAALLVNLKRGPWFGVLIAGLFLAFSYSRRLAFALIALAVFLSCTIPPIRDRLLVSYDHFTIAGGREEMWEIGIELAAKYPMGIGFRNAQIMQELDPTIPPSHRHFHNNLLNILVETGWLGLGVYLWWLLTVFKVALRSMRNAPAPLGIAFVTAALLSWQLAGIVEYNFGDSEVYLCGLIALGLLMKEIFHEELGRHGQTTSSVAS